jgi:hypothetical protein
MDIVVERPFIPCLKADFCKGQASASFIVVLGVAYLDASLFAVYNTDRWKQSPIGIFVSDIFSIIQA